MFKINQKVRVVEWVDMPEDVKDSMGRNTWRIGEVGTLVAIPERLMSLGFYDILFKGDKHPIGLFEGEIEPAIKVGQQLLLWEE